MVVTDLEGKIVEGELRPSSDLATHLELYKAFPKNWRRGAHAFGVCDGVGAGAKAGAMFWDDARGLFLWGGPGHGADEFRSD